MTFGAGYILPFKGDTLWVPNHYRGYQVVDNGPLRSTFRLDCEQWNAGGMPVKVSELVSLDAGSRMNRVEVLFESPEKKTFPAAIGIVQRSGTGGHVIMDKDAGLMGYREPAHGERSEEHTSELQSLMRISYAVFCLKKKKKKT